MIGRWALTLAVFAAAVGLARAEPPGTLKVLRECPAKGWHRACLPIAFFFSDDQSGRLRIKTDGNPYSRGTLDHILVDGSLLEGRGPGTFRLRLDYPISDSEADSPNELGGFAFIGRSKTGLPVVMTDRGPLEIRTPGIDFESPGDLFVVHEKSRRIVSKVIGGYGMPFVATKAGNVGVWDSKRAICISAPSRKTRELQIITTACRAAGVPADGTILGGNVTGEVSISLEDARLLVGDPVNVDIYGAPGTGLLLIWANWEYCC